jgi:hypothetical protein
LLALSGLSSVLPNTHQRRDLVFLFQRALHLGQLVIELVLGRVRVEEAERFMTGAFAFLVSRGDIGLRIRTPLVPLRQVISKLTRIAPRSVSSGLLGPRTETTGSPQSSPATRTLPRRPRG